MRESMKRWLRELPRELLHWLLKIALLIGALWFYMVVVRDHAKAKPDSQILLALLGLFIFGIYAFEIFRWFIKSRLGKYDSDFYEAEDLKINDYPPPLILLAGALAAFLAIHLFIETFFR